MQPRQIIDAVEALGVEHKADSKKLVEELNQLLQAQGISDQPIAYEPPGYMASWNLGCDKLTEKFRRT